MIIPLRHDQSAVRRWPYVSGAIILICLVSFLLTDTSSYESLPSADDYLQEAADFWRDNAYLEAEPEVVTIVAYDVRPNERKTYLALLQDFSEVDWQNVDEDFIAEQQAELDRLTAYGLGRERPPELASVENPFLYWGYVPSRGNLLGLFTSIFMHAGWIHLLGNLFMFWLAGPAIEDRLGRPGFAVFFLLAGAFSAGFYGFFTRHPDAPLVGASGAIAGTMGAFLLRFWHSEIKFAYFFLVGLRPIFGTFQAKAWIMLPLWFANELIQTWWDRSSGLSSGVAYEAHIGGFLFGAATLGALRFWKLEERYLDPLLEAKVTHVVGNPLVEEASELRVQGDAEGAWTRLEAAFAEAPDDAEIGLALWDAGRATGREEAAAAAMAVCVQTDVREGQLDLAARNWCELTNVVPQALCDATTLVRILPVLQQHDDPSFAVRAMRHIVDPDNATTTPGIALRVLEVAREIDPPSALAAAGRALESPEMHEAKRDKLIELVAQLEGEGVEALESVATLAARERVAAEAAREDRSIAIESDIDEQPVGVAPSPIATEPPPIPGAGAPSAVPPPLPTEALGGAREAGVDVSESDLDDIDLSEYDLSEYESEYESEDVTETYLPEESAAEVVVGALSRFADLKLVEARPVTFHSGVLGLEVTKQRSKSLPLSKVEAIAVGVVADLGQKPVLVVDLVLNWLSLDDTQARVIRLRSDRFDPRALTPGESRPKRALKSFLTQMLADSGADPIPSREVLCGGEGWPKFDTLLDYEREILGVDR